MSRNLISSLLSRPDLAGVPAVLLFGGPYVVLNGSRLEVPDGSKRLLVFVALGAGESIAASPQARSGLSGMTTRAGGNLRSALWRLRCAGIDLLESDKRGLG